MIVLDTTFLIDFMRGEKKALKILKRKQPLLTTQINMYEIIRGLFLQNVSSFKFMKIMELFESIRVLSLDDHALIKAAGISSSLVKKGEMIPDCDCLVAGIALSNGVKNIATRNIKHFKKIKDARVISY